jgi:molecular chaperone GrpE
MEQHTQNTTENPQADEQVKAGQDVPESESHESENTENQVSDESSPKENESGDSSPEQESNDLEAQLSELRDKYLRLMAEFDNYKKRTLKEKIDLMRTAAQDTMSALLPVLDDFDRAKKMAEAEGSAEVFSDGVRLVYQKLYQVLKNRGLEPMETEGKAFDPESHEAITDIPAPTEDMKGKIVDTIEKGYTLNEKIIRHAKVVVGR